MDDVKYNVIISFSLNKIYATQLLKYAKENNFKSLNLAAKNIVANYMIFHYEDKKTKKQKINEGEM